MIKVYLGGTCNGSAWRDELIGMIDKNIQTYNPIVEKWDASSSDNYEIKRGIDFLLYVLTPELNGFMSIANAVDASNKMPEKLKFYDDPGPGC